MGFNSIKTRLESSWIEYLNKNSTMLSKNTLDGSTPPSVFVGMYGYPKIRVGPMVPPIHGNTSLLDTPEMWSGRSIREIASFRLSLVRGLMTMDAYAVSGRYIELLHELALADSPVESELVFEKKPVLDIYKERNDLVDSDSGPFGPSASVKSFTVSSLSTNKKIEKLYYDKDLAASEAISNLYTDGIKTSRINRLLSLGMLGKKRKLVPTKWSITATDKIISDSLIEKIKNFSSIKSFEITRYYHLGNQYSIILIPSDIWSFEMHEVWHDNVGNTEVRYDYEGGLARSKQYPSIAGAFFAARLGVSEYLFKRKRISSAIVFREIFPEYIMPLGVWQVREGVRSAFCYTPVMLEDFDSALSFACLGPGARRVLIKNSIIYNDFKKQTRLTSFL